MLTKSLLPSVSRMLLITCLAISLRMPVMLPEVSIRMRMSLGLVAASIYQLLVLQSKRSTGSMTQLMAGYWRMKPVALPKYCQDRDGSCS